MPAPVQRRQFLRNLCAAGCIPYSAARAQSSSIDNSPATDVTKRLAEYVVSGKFEELASNVRKEGARTLLNWVGCALGGSTHDAVTNAIAAMSAVSMGQHRIVGRKERLNIFHATLVNGISSHVLDFDDTHLKTVIHPGGSVIPAILALAERQPVSGRDFMNALVLGVEVECRIGNAVYPAHYDAGWHISGTAGVFGAAAATGKLLGLSHKQMVWALGLAASQPVGLRAMFGSMNKSFHVGRAAENGLTAALLASRNFTSSEQGLEAKSGWANVLSTTRNYAAITDGLGSSYEILLNTYKPYACGIVIHPTIDGCIQLRNQHKLTAEQIERIDLKVHPLVLELTGKRAPQTGLDGKFSVYFAAALAIVEGAAGVKQFTDRLVQDSRIVQLRDRVNAIADRGVHEDQVRVVITLKDGRRLEKFVEHAKGSVEQPMSDSELDAKFRDLSEGVLPTSHTQKLISICRGIESLSDVSQVLKAAIPG